MALLREHCPRCDTSNSTFDVLAQKSRGIVTAGWIEGFELFAVCRHCHRGTIFIVRNDDYNSRNSINDPNGLVNRNGYLNDIVKLYGYVSLKDQDIPPSPEYTPKEISKVYLEGATCISVQCWNAAGAMFRSAIDLATKVLLPPEEETEPPKKVRRSLGLRLAWLFEHNQLPVELKELAEAVQQDGNDGVHDANLSKEDALDLQDFTQQLLTRLFTVPGRIEAAKMRREERRSRAGNS